MKDIWEDNIPEAPVFAEALKPLMDAIEQKKVLEERIEKGEALLKDLKEQQRKLDQETIPAMLIEAGTNEISIDGYGKVGYSAQYRASLKSGEDEAFRAWALENGYGDMYKEQYIVENPSPEDKARLQDAGVLCRVKNATAPQTLNKIARLLNEAGESYPECLNVFEFNKTTVKKK